MIPEIVDEAIEELETRLDTIRERIKAGLKRNPWYVKDKFNVDTLIAYAKEQRATLYQGYNTGTSPLEVKIMFIVRYSRSPREIIIKDGTVLAGPITKKEHQAKCNLTNS